MHSTLKGQLLLALLNGGGVDDALVFTRTKHRADRLTRLLTRNGIKAERIHGNRSQAQRTRALDGFKAGDFQVLVATDIAARGIDVEALGHVVNFDLPTVPEDYIHRVGRTARAGATGMAITLVAPEEEGDLGRIERVLASKLSRMRLEGFAYEAVPDAQLAMPSGARVRGRRTVARQGATGGGDPDTDGGRPRRRRFGRRRR